MVRAFRTPLRQSAGLISLLLWAGCSLLVEPPTGDLRCKLTDDGDAQPCPGDLRCVDGRCKAPEDRADGGNRADARTDGPTCSADPDTEEDCNGIDDDCDGEVDEGHDSDEDGATWCGGGRKEDADCDDFDEKTNPDAKEVCDGRDNDCDGEIDEAGDGDLCSKGEQCIEQRCVTPSCLFGGSMSDCPSGTRCDASGQCLPATPCDVDADCSGDETCDDGMGICIEVGKVNGQPCASHLECASGDCIDADAIRLSGDAERVCGKACCTDGDCGSDEFCFSSGSGARSCLPRSMDPRGEAAPPACTVDAGCSAPQRCAVRDQQRIEEGEFTPRVDLETAVCGLPVGTDGRGAPCFSDSECASGVCEFICSEPCGSSAECREAFGSAAFYCRTQSSGFLSPDYVSSCVLGRDEVGPGLQGEACTASSDCADAGCVIPSGAESGFCANLCCSDSQCSGDTRCRPLAFGERYEMRCVP